MKNNPYLVTVIIPMYNAQKYIDECLQSLVEQTFQNFEVIVIDDCSTDCSVAEVKKFIPQFNNRLQIKSLKKNSGGSAIPKNTGLKMARGKYVTFLDSDDYFSKTALEEIVKIAEDTDAEVIHCAYYFTFKDGENKISKGTFQQTCHVDKTTLEPFDIGERIKKFIERGILWWGCNKLFRRNFLLENKITFPTINVWEDLVFTFKCIVCAKNYVRVPNCFYYYRNRQDSLSHVPKDAFGITGNLLKVVNYLDDFMSQKEFFQKNPKFRYMILDWHIQGRMNIVSDALYKLSNLNPMQVDTLFRQKFKEDFPNEQLAFASYFYAMANYERFYIKQLVEEKNQLQQKISALQGQLAQNH